MDQFKGKIAWTAISPKNNNETFNKLNGGN